MAANRKAPPPKVQPVREEYTGYSNYVVVGPHAVLEVEHGGVVELSDKQAASLVLAGAVIREDEYVPEDQVDVGVEDIVQVSDSDSFGTAENITDPTAGVAPVDPDGEPTTDQVEPVRPVEDGAQDDSVLAPEEVEAVRDEVRATLEQAGLVRHAETDTDER